MIKTRFCTLFTFFIIASCSNGDEKTSLADDQKPGEKNKADQQEPPATDTRTKYVLLNDDDGSTITVILFSSYENFKKNKPGDCATYPLQPGECLTIARNQLGLLQINNGIDEIFCGDNSIPCLPGHYKIDVPSQWNPRFIHLFHFHLSLSKKGEPDIEKTCTSLKCEK